MTRSTYPAGSHTWLLHSWPGAAFYLIFFTNLHAVGLVERALQNTFRIQPSPSFNEYHDVLWSGPACSKPQHSCGPVGVVEPPCLLPVLTLRFTGGCLGLIEAISQNPYLVGPKTQLSYVPLGAVAWLGHSGSYM